MPTDYLPNALLEECITRFQEAKINKIKYELIRDDIDESNKRLARRNHKVGPLMEFRPRFEYYNNIFMECQQELAAHFYKLSQNFVRYAKFNLVEFDDQIQEGVVICFEKVDRFDARKGKAFNYLTTCIYNHIKQLYRTCRNYNEFKKRYHEFLQIHDDGIKIRERVSKKSKSS